MSLHLSTLDWIILAVYFTVILSVGLWFTKISARGLRSYFLGENGQKWWMETGAPCSTRILQGLGVVNPAYPVLQIPVDEAFLDSCLALTHELKSAEGVELSTLPIRGMALLAQLFLMAEQKRKSTPAEDLVERACSIIRNNIDDRVTLPELLSQLPASYSWTRTLFQRKMKQSMEAYRIRCRIDRALSHLTTGMTVKQTALKLGYSDSFAFSNQFKKVTGYPPTWHPGIK